MAPPKATDEEQLRAVLNNPHSSQCRDFIKFLKAQHCFENLLFWWAVERYKEEWDSLPANANPTALKCQARSLCNTFIVCREALCIFHPTLLLSQPPCTRLSSQSFSSILV